MIWFQEVYGLQRLWQRHWPTHPKRPAGHPWANLVDLVLTLDASFLCHCSCSYHDCFDCCSSWWWWWWWRCERAVRVESILGHYCHSNLYLYSMCHASRFYPCCVVHSSENFTPGKKSTAHSRGDTGFCFTIPIPYWKQQWVFNVVSYFWIYQTTGSISTDTAVG